ncbi:transposase [Candidatus Gracilibacteria bacterium]|nr:transposase [Candidatus Gracilibacteria bacterium]
MPKRLEFEENAYYHVYNRGLNKQILFHNNKDFQRFLLYLDIYKNKCKKELGIISYCILPNHFHFVLLNKSQSHKISYFIGNICASYTRYYKAKYGADKGVLYFESRFKAKLIDNDEYLQQCIQYVEYNALKHKLVEKGADRIFRSDSGSKLGSEILDLDWEFEF